MRIQFPTDGYVLSPPICRNQPSAKTTPVWGNIGHLFVFRSRYGRFGNGFIRGGLLDRLLDRLSGGLSGNLPVETMHASSLHWILRWILRSPLSPTFLPSIPSWLSFPYPMAILSWEINIPCKWFGINTNSSNSAPVHPRVCGERCFETSGKP